jgi:hypothetical protein
MFSNEAQRVWISLRRLAKSLSAARIVVNEQRRSKQVGLGIFGTISHERIAFHVEYSFAAGTKVKKIS